MVFEWFCAIVIISIIYLLVKGEHDRTQQEKFLKRKFRKKLAEYRQACIEYGQCDADAEEAYLKKKTEEFNQIIDEVFEWVKR